jgi:hypothetical protein
MYNLKYILKINVIQNHFSSQINPLQNEFLLNNTLYINSVRTSQGTRYVTATKQNRLMLFRETVAVYCEDHTENTNTLRRRNA